MQSKPGRVLCKKVSTVCIDSCYRYKVCFESVFAYSAKIRDTRLKIIIDRTAKRNEDQGDK